jgi:hypothetical protein
MFKILSRAGLLLLVLAALVVPIFAAAAEKAGTGRDAARWARKYGCSFDELCGGDLFMETARQAILAAGAEQERLLAELKEIERRMTEECDGDLDAEREDDADQSGGGDRSEEQPDGSAGKPADDWSGPQDTGPEIAPDDDTWRPNEEQAVVAHNGLEGPAILAASGAVDEGCPHFGCGSRWLQEQPRAIQWYTLVYDADCRPHPGAVWFSLPDLSMRQPTFASGRADIFVDPAPRAPESLLAWDQELWEGDRLSDDWRRGRSQEPSFGVRVLYPDDEHGRARLFAWNPGRQAVEVPLAGGGTDLCRYLSQAVADSVQMDHLWGVVQVAAVRPDAVVVSGDRIRRTSDGADWTALYLEDADEAAIIVVVTGTDFFSSYTVLHAAANDGTWQSRYLDLVKSRRRLPDSGLALAEIFATDRRAYRVLAAAPAGRAVDSAASPKEAFDELMPDGVRRWEDRVVRDTGVGGDLRFLLAEGDSYVIAGGAGSRTVVYDASRLDESPARAAVLPFIVLADPGFEILDLQGEDASVLVRRRDRAGSVWALRIRSGGGFDESRLYDEAEPSAWGTLSHSVLTEAVHNDANLSRFLVECADEGRPVVLLDRREASTAIWGEPVWLVAKGPPGITARTCGELRYQVVAGAYELGLQRREIEIANAGRDVESWSDLAGSAERWQKDLGPAVLSGHVGVPAHLVVGPNAVAAWFRGDAGTDVYAAPAAEGGARLLIGDFDTVMAGDDLEMAWRPAALSRWRRPTISEFILGCVASDFRQVGWSANPLGRFDHIR